MIQFAAFLQDNKKKQNKAQEKITQESHLRVLREEEYAAKKKICKLLKECADRIEKKKRALYIFEDYLEKVKNSSDEFSEIVDILSRHKTLISENQKLDQTNEAREQELEEKKRSVQQYEKEKRQEILQLNNDIANKKAELEKIIDEQNELKAEAEEIGQKKRDKITEFAQILMAINDLEDKCRKRSEKDEKDRNSYKSTIRHQVNGKEPHDLFNSFGARCQYARSQLKAIQNYLRDFKEVKRVLEENPEVQQFIHKKREKGEFI